MYQQRDEINIREILFILKQDPVAAVGRSDFIQVLVEESCGEDKIHFTRNPKCQVFYYLPQGGTSRGSKFFYLNFLCWLSSL